MSHSALDNSRTTSPPSPKTVCPPWWVEVAWALGIALLYFVIARLSLYFVIQDGLAVVWPPSGFLLAVLLLARRRSWPLILAGVFLANALANLAGKNSLAVSLGFAFANTLEPVTVATLLIRFVGLPMTFHRLKDVLGLTLLAAGVGTALTSLVGAAVPALGLGAPYWHVWTTWWIADGVGMLLVAPLILTWATSLEQLRKISAWKAAEALALLLLLIAVTVVVFGRYVEQSEYQFDAYVIFPLLIWSALRLGPRETSTYVFILAVLAILLTTQGRGPLAQGGGNLEHWAKNVQLYLSVAALTAMTLAAVIAERRQAGVALQENEKRFRLLFESARDAIFLADANTGIVTHCNHAASRLLGYEREEIIGKHQTFLHPPEEVEQYREHFRQHVLVLPFRVLEAEILRKDGARVPVEISSSLIEFSGQKYMQGVFRDVSERKRAEKSLRESEERFRTLSVLAPVGIYLTDAAGKCQYANPRWIEMAGLTLEESLGDGWVNALHPEDRAGVISSWQQMVESQGRWGLEYRFQAREGKVTWAYGLATPLRNLVGNIIGYVGINIDITDRKRAEDELARHREHLEELVEERTRALDESNRKLHRSQRLASLGTFAAGIAHEINNPLGMMLLSTDIALESLHKPDALAELLQRQKNNVERCSRIVKGVLDFARQQSTQKWPLDLNEAVARSLDFAREYARQNGVVVESALAPGLDTILGNMTELEQVVVNLVQNAVQSCNAGGQVMVETCENGDKVRLVVRDNGCGMTPEQMEHACDPFYTTRLETGGTGLGLSTVHGIVSSHQGTLDIHSEKGEGSVFTIEFPCYLESEVIHVEDSGH